MIDNFPSGFASFVARIETLTEVLGGTIHARVEVEREFCDTLTRIIERRYTPDGQGYADYKVVGDRHTSLWTDARREEFDEAGQRAEAFLRARTDKVLQTWNSAPLGGLIALRAGGLWFERADYGIMLAEINTSEQYEPRQQGNIFKYMSALTDSGQRIAQRLGRKPTPAIITSRTEESAEKVLRRWADTIFALPEMRQKVS